MLKKIIFSLLICMATTACSSSDVDQTGSSNALLKNELFGVYKDQSKLFAYDSDLHQYAYSTQRRTFRIQNAAQDRYLSCELDAEPVANQQVTASIKTKGISSFPTQELQLLVLKKANGKVWLWNAEKRIGLVIQFE